MCCAFECLLLPSSINGNLLCWPIISQLNANIFFVVESRFCCSARNSGSAVCLVINGLVAGWLVGVLTHFDCLQAASVLSSFVCVHKLLSTICVKFVGSNVCHIGWVLNC